MKQKCLKGIKKLLVVSFAFLIFSNESVFANNNLSNLTFYNGSFSFFKKSGETKILEMVNEERRKRNLSSLVWDSRLASLARSYSSKMANEDFFSHTDKKGKNLVDRVKEFNIKKWNGIGENLYFCKGYDDPTVPAFKGWMKSPGHRSNILNSSWKSTGIGIAVASDGRIYVTQVFMK